MINETGLVSHYTKHKRLEKILKDGIIRFGPVERLEDPRESDLDWIDAVCIGENFNIDSLNDALRIKQKVGRHLRVFCTAQPNEGLNSIESSIYGRPRMWSQYGDKFKGFCVLFEKDKLIQLIEESILKNDLILHDTVAYLDWLHLVQGGISVEYGEGVFHKEKTVLDLINDNQMLHSIYFKKGADWKEEREYRWLLYSERNIDIIVDIKKAIHSVVLGPKFPEDDYKDAKDYCKLLGCRCYALRYDHPEYNLISFI